MKKKFFLTAMVVLYAAIAFLISYVVYIGGRYPVGGSTYEYLYHGRLLLDEITNGNFFPIYDKNWYNGSLFLRVYEPIPEYLMAFLIYIVDCDASKAFLLYLAMIFFFGAIAWLYIGSKRGHLILGSVLGVLWFFMPNNMHTFFLLGNLQRSLGLCLVPLLFYFAFNCFYEETKKWNITKLILCTFIMCLVDFQFLGICGIVILLWCIGFLFHFEHKKRIVAVLFSLILGIGMAGIWLYPYYRTSIHDIYNVEVMKHYFQDFWVTINPVYRMEGNDQRFYYGLAALAVALLGVIASNKKGRLGYRIAIILYLASTSSFYILLSTITDDAHFYMLQFISIALCLILIELLYWDTIKKFVLSLCIALLALDCVPSVLVNIGNGAYTSYEQISAFEKATLIEEARKITKQRMIFYDNGIYESVAQYCATLGSESTSYVPQVLGMNWQYSISAEKVVDINESMERRAYVAFFDTLLQMGCDTAVICADVNEYLYKDISLLIEAGEKLGYQLWDNSGKFFLFHKDTPECFGTINEYSAICIGTSGRLMSYPYIDMYVGESDDLLDYSFEELMQYRVVYLSGFTYKDKKAAEELVLSLANNGVKIVIDAANLMADEYTGQREFLGVWCQNISFSNGFPILYVNNEEVICSYFPKENKNWNSVYLNGLTEVTGYLYDNNIEVAFMGHAQSDNITYIGINLPYHYFLTLDYGSGKIMNIILGDYLHEAPTRKIVPLEISYDNNRIRIQSQYDEVNTTLAYLDMFESNQTLTKKHNLLYVDQGTTYIDLTYRLYFIGIMISCISVVIYLLFMLGIYWKEKRNL